MAMNLNVIMTTENEEFLNKWKTQGKEQKRVSMMKDVHEFVNKRAFDDFGLEQSAYSKEVCKLLLIAKECLEKENSE